MRSLPLVLVVACSGSKSPPTITPQPHATSAQPMVATSMRPACGNDVMKCALDTVGYFSEEACRCTDRACADRVNKELSQ